jgi:hypothetical protein
MELVRAFERGTVIDERAPGTGFKVLAFSPDGTKLTLAWNERDHARINTWDTASGRRLTEARGPAGPVRAVAFARQGDLRVAVGGMGVPEPNSSNLKVQPLSVWHVPPA